MNTIEGFVRISSKATTCNGAKNPAEFIGKTCAVMEFADDGGVLVLNPEGTALAMFDKEDVVRSFKCTYADGVVMPPGLDVLERILYLTRVQERKGGYSPILRNMVIEASLMKGVFTDAFLWQLQ